MALSSLRNLLSGSLNRAGIRKSVKAAMIVEAANRIIPGHLPGMQAYDVVAISYKDGILRLRVKNSAARYALRGIEPILLMKLQEEFPSSSIKQISSFLSKEPSRYELP